MMVEDVTGKADTVMISNGDTVYYNSGRQRLPKGSDSEVLTLASGLPSWATAGGGSLELLDHHEASGTESTYTFTPASALDMADTYESIIVAFSGKTSGSLALDFKFNGLTEYHTTFNRNVLGTISGSHIGSAVNIELMSTGDINSARGIAGFIEMGIGLADGGSVSYWYRGTTQATTRSLNPFAGGTSAQTQTTFTSFQLFTSTSTIIAGTTIDIWGRKRA